ncbi:hypothetical protein [Sinosporangium siamense]|uniref:hypothetical protein n=1 Tax=Sinosporangium siamense TaxID=1367973 RepID=UPI001951E934|nr:hypothetical protein [Sinosporangium siamense]
MHFLDFAIDGRSLLDRMAAQAGREPDTVSVLWLKPPLGDNHREILRLLRQHESPLEDGRIPLYTCPECGDLGCGATTITLASTVDQMIWRDFGWQTDYDDTVDHDNYSGLGPFVFDRTDYEATLTAALALLPVPAPAPARSRRLMWWRRA